MWWIFAFLRGETARIHHRSQFSFGTWWILALELHRNRLLAPRPLGVANFRPHRTLKGRFWSKICSNTLLLCEYSFHFIEFQQPVTRS
ncbi:hypothetical protein CYL77_13935 [Corynebacterium glutamicum]|nr:hypothetical protein B7P23_14735 [Corynebacterium glutamicum]AUI02138.1 hypothetical protein CYL77_13935 [Corynebacterium glutamicum]AUI02954.1 hypothetical protein C0I99_01935 [Corynebacterium glutamicum]